MVPRRQNWSEEEVPGGCQASKVTNLEVQKEREYEGELFKGEYDLDFKLVKMIGYELRPQLRF